MRKTLLASAASLGIAGCGAELPYPITAEDKTASRERTHQANLAALETQDSGYYSSVESNRHWSVVSWDRKVSPLDGNVQFRFHNQSYEGKNQWGDAISLIPVCRKNRTYVFLDWGVFVDLRSRRVKMRIDDGEVETFYLPVTNDHTETYFSGAKAISLLRRLANAERVVFEMTPSSHYTITAQFDTKSYAAPTKVLARTCNWSL